MFCYFQYTVDMSIAWSTSLTWHVVSPTVHHWRIMFTNCPYGCAGIGAFCLWFYISGLIQNCEVSERCWVKRYEGKRIVVIESVWGDSESERWVWGDSESERWECEVIVRVRGDSESERWLRRSGNTKVVHTKCGSKAHWIICSFGSIPIRIGIIHIVSTRCCWKSHELSRVLNINEVSVVKLFMISCFVFNFLMDMHRKCVSTERSCRHLQFERTRNQASPFPREEDATPQVKSTNSYIQLRS